MKNTVVRFAAVAAVFAGLVLAQGPGFPGRGPGQAGQQAPRQNFLDFLSTYLGLTDSQKQQATGIFDTARQAGQPLRDQLKQAHDALNTATKASKSDAEIDQLAAAVGNLIGQSTAIQAKASAKFNAILTADQRDKLDKLPGPMRGRMGGPMGGPPPAM